MKFLYLLFIVSFASCAPKYSLVLKMKPSNTPPGGAYYENDSLQIKFVVRDSYIWVHFKNKMDKGIKINWDEVSFSLNGKSYARVLHNLTGVAKVNDVQPTTTIPPRSYIEDKLYPRETMYISRSNYGYWSTSVSFFRIKKANEGAEKYMRSRIGDVLVIHLPYYVGLSFVESNFEITVVDVVKKKKK